MGIQRFSHTDVMDFGEFVEGMARCGCLRLKETIMPIRRKIEHCVSHTLKAVAPRNLHGHSGDHGALLEVFRDNAQYVRAVCARRRRYGAAAPGSFARSGNSFAGGSASVVSALL